MDTFIKKGSELYNLFQFAKNANIPDFQIFKLGVNKLLVHYDVSYGHDNMIIVDVIEDRCVIQSEYSNCFNKLFFIFKWTTS